MSMQRIVSGNTSTRDVHTVIKKLIASIGTVTWIISNAAQRAEATTFVIAYLHVRNATGMKNVNSAGKISSDQNAQILQSSACEKTGLMSGNHSFPYFLQSSLTAKPRRLDWHC